MKIRNGFVSNSSSSSFCIYGAQVSLKKEHLIKVKKALPKLYQSKIEELKKNKAEYVKEYLPLLENIDNEEFFGEIKRRGCEHKIPMVMDAVDTVKFCPECGKPAWITEVNPNNKKLEKISEEIMAFMIGLDLTCGEESSYIGRSWDSIRDDETGAEFKKSVDDVLMVINGMKGSTCEEAWYNG